MSADNWSKLYLGGKLVIDQWDNGKNNGTSPYSFTSGQILPIQVEYAEIDDNAWTSIEWRLVGRTMF